jgi:hypothetical protein
MGTGGRRGATAAERRPTSTVGRREAGVNRREAGVDRQRAGTGVLPQGLDCFFPSIFRVLVAKFRNFLYFYVIELVACCIFM